MAYKPSDWDGGYYNGNPTAYPDGAVLDGTTRVNAKSFGDMQQFFLKIAREAGITLNSTAENETNGLQFWEALLQTDFSQAWTDVSSFGTQWAAAANQPKYTKDYSGRVNVMGIATSTGTTPNAVITTLPSGYRPVGGSAGLNFPCTAFNATGSTWYTAYINVNSLGEVGFISSGQIPTASNWFVILNFSFLAR